MKHQQEKKETIRKNILNGAIELFSKQGYAKTTMKMLSKHLNISEGLAYNYFNSKEEILDEILMQLGDMFENVGQITLVNKSNKKDLENYINKYFNMIADNTEFVKFGYAMTLSPETSNKVKAYINTKISNILQILSDFFLKTGYENPEMTALEFMAIIDGTSQHYLGTSQEVYPIETMINYLKIKYCN